MLILRLSINSIVVDRSTLKLSWSWMSEDIDPSGAAPGSMKMSLGADGRLVLQEIAP